MLLNIHFTFVSHKSITFVAVNSAKKYIAITVIAKCSINACPMYTRRIGTVNGICHKLKKIFFFWLKMVSVMNIRNILAGKETS